MSENQIHVIAENDFWSVRDPDNPAPLSKHEDQDGAIKAAEKLARTMFCRLYVHDQDGNVALYADFARLNDKSLDVA